MAVLSTKHARQQQVALNDFSGGLNTSASMAGIQPNQLAEVVNMELDSVTGKLKTVAGTVDVLPCPDGIVLWAAAWDEINKKMFLVDADKNAYVTDFATVEAVGRLSGDLYPVIASWEDGILVSSGGKLQYYNGTSLVTLDESPLSQSVYTRASRVVVTTDNEVHYSAVGDETNWSEESNDDSSSVWVEAGYKDGGKFLGMVNLSSDILILKNNRRVYRLSGEYPDWSIAEVSRNVECLGRRAFASMAGNVFVLGKNEVQVLETTADYGDVKPQNVGSNVSKELASMPEDTMVRFVPPLSQMWFIGNSGVVLVFDTTHGAWFIRKFHAPVVDVVSVGDDIYIVKPDRISKLKEGEFQDSGKDLPWKFRAKRLESHNEYLLKRAQISVLPFSTSMYSGFIRIGAVILPIPIQEYALNIWHNRAKIHKNKTKICARGRSKGIYVAGELIYQNPAPIYGNRTKIFNRRDIIKESRNVFRSKYLAVEGNGSSCGFVLNGIALDLVEV